GDDQFRVGYLLQQQTESVNHHFQALVGSPFAKGENAMWMAATREIRKLRSTRKNAMRAQMHVVTSVFVVEDLSISRHQDRDRIPQQDHACGDGSGGTIKPLVANTRILEVNGIHQVVQGDVRVTSAEARKQRRHQAAESDQGAAPECTEQKIEPNDIGLQSLD